LQGKFRSVNLLPLSADHLASKSCASRRHWEPINKQCLDEIFPLSAFFVAFLEPARSYGKFSNSKVASNYRTSTCWCDNPPHCRSSASHFIWMWSRRQIYRAKVIALHEVRDELSYECSNYFTITWRCAELAAISLHQAHR
jgi:hypothetical protein